MKISACLICKPSDQEAEVLYRALSYISPYVDEVCVTITGENKKVEEVCESFGNVKISHFKWNNDFSAARNFNFSQATGDYIFWCDTDDIVKGAENIRPQVERMEKMNIDCGTMDYLYHFDENNICDVKHRKTRIVKNDGCVKWYGEIHEDLLPEREVNNFFIEDIQVLHLTTDDRIEESKKRNLEISLSILEKRPEDPTAMWNAAKAYYGLGKPKEAIKHFNKFITCSGSEIEIATAHQFLSNCYMDLEDFDKAKEEAAKVIVLEPHFPDGYLLLGDIYFKLGNPKKAKEFLVMGLSKEIPVDEYIVWEPRNYDFNPLMMLAQVYMELGQPENSSKCLKECLKIYPNNERVKQLLETTEKEIEKLKKVDEIAEKAKTINDKKELAKLLDQVPDELKSHPKICVIRNTHFIKTKSTGRDIAIYCYYTAEEFNPELIMKRGTGGSEEAVYQVSKRLKDLGWNVVVYANCGIKEKWYDGVLWKPWWTINMRDKWDKLIMWRHPMGVEFDEVATKDIYIWLHDVLKEKEFTPKRLNKIKKIIVLSEYQRNLFPNIPNDKFMISANGIDAELFRKKRGTIKREPYRLIYTSSYDRGLKTLLKLFPTIKKEIPQAELHIFYGWNTWDAMYKSEPTMQKEKQEIENLMKQPGVFHHGRVSQEQIVDEYFKSSILAYPSEFSEISFLSGMKAQAAGCIPITTNVAAIDETIQFGLKVDSNNIYTDEFAQDEWVNGVIQLLKNPPTEKERKEMMNWACKKFDWNSVVKQWDKEFKNEISK